MKFKEENSYLYYLNGNLKFVLVIYGFFFVHNTFFAHIFNEIGATTTDLPPGVLYRVKATYKYVKEDVDELSFEVGETIQVIEYDDPEDQVAISFSKLKKNFKFFSLND